MTKAGITTSNLFEHISKFAIGFEPLLREFETKSSYANYPPYNMIETGKDSVTIEVAVAGFGKEELSVEQEANQLLINGGQTKKDSESVKYLHKGISSRSFILSWTLAEYTEVTDVILRDGVLKVELTKHVPEEKRPKSFDIK